MTRRLPRCAYCGELLKDTDYMLRQFPDVGGKPEVGWHARQSGDCFDQDSVGRLFQAGDSKKLVALLRQIEGRGEGRLVANKGWLKVAAAD